MNTFLKAMAVLGLVLVMGGMVASMHYSGLYQNSMLTMNMQGQELGDIKENIATVFRYLHHTVWAQRTAMGGSILMAVSLLALLFRQDKRIGAIEKGSSES